VANFVHSFEAGLVGYIWCYQKCSWSTCGQQPWIRFIRWFYCYWLISLCI